MYEETCICIWGATKKKRDDGIDGVRFVMILRASKFKQSRLVWHLISWMVQHQINIPFIHWTNQFRAQLVKGESSKSSYVFIWKKWFTHIRDHRHSKCQAESWDEDKHTPGFFRLETFCRRFFFCCCFHLFRRDDGKKSKGNKRKMQQVPQLTLFSPVSWIFLSFPLRCVADVDSRVSFICILCPCWREQSR